MRGTLDGEIDRVYALAEIGPQAAVAIPALIAYRIFRARVDDFLVEMEQQSLRLVDLLKGTRR